MTFDDFVQLVDEHVRATAPGLPLVMANRPSERFGSVAWRRKADAEIPAGQTLPAVRTIELDGDRALFLYFGSDWQRPDATETVTLDEPAAGRAATRIADHLDGRPR